MAMQTPIAALLTDTVYIASVTARSSTGLATWGTATSVASRVQTDEKSYDGPNGTTIKTTHKLFFNTTRVPLEGDRVWLPGADHNSAAAARTIYEVKRLPGLTSGSTSHYEVRV
jgi:hypothetical protein